MERRPIQRFRGAIVLAWLVASAALRQATTVIQEQLRAAHAQATLRWTGQAALNFDLWRSSADDTRRAERRTLPLTLALLLLAFGSVVAAVFTAASGALSVGLALGLVALAADHWPLSILAVNVASMIGLAVGIDYALLTVSRFREARAAGASPEEAAAQAARHAGGTVALSGLTVAIGRTTRCSSWRGWPRRGAPGSRRMRPWRRGSLAPDPSSPAPPPS